MTTHPHPLDAIRRRTDLTTKAKGDILEVGARPAIEVEFPGITDIRPDPAGDKGVDRIGTLPSGETVTFQMKLYGPDSSVDLNDVTNFTARSRHFKAVTMVLIVTGRITRNAMEHLHEEGVLVWDYDYLIRFPIDWDSIVADITAPPAPPAYPTRQAARPHQVEALFAINTEDTRGQCIMATATGKTHVLIEYGGAQGLTAVGVPSIELIQQHIPDIRRQFPEAPVLAICSADELRHSVYGLPVEFTTDQAHVEQWLRDHAAPGSGVPAFVLVTYASGPVLVDAAVMTETVFDAAVFDEAHRTATVSPKRRPARSSAMVTGLPARRYRFFTATPRLHTASLKKEIADAGGIDCSMDNHDLYGPVLHELTYTQARDAELVVPFTFLVGIVTRADVLDLIHKGGKAYFEDIDLADPEYVEDVANAIHTLRSASDASLQSILSVHNTVARAQRAVNIYCKVAAALGLTINTMAVSASSDESHRQRARYLLDSPAPGTISVVCNVRLFTEGVNAPRIDGIAYFDSRSSAIDVVQTIGRGTRRHDSSGKDCAFVILPMFTDETTDVDEAIRLSRFDKFYALGSALRDGGITVRQWVTSLRTSSGITPKLPADAFVITEPMHGDFDTSLLMSALRTVASTGSWAGYTSVINEAVHTDPMKALDAIARMHHDYQTAGLRPSEASDKVREQLAEMVAAAGGDIESFMDRLGGAS